MNKKGLDLLSDLLASNRFYPVFREQPVLPLG